MKQLSRMLMLTLLPIAVGAHAQQVPGLLSYQGRIAVGGTNFTGAGQFRFALVDVGTNASRQATASAVVNSGFLTSINVTAGGAGYVSAPAVLIADPTGSNAAATAYVGGGAVTGIVVNNPGAGYSAAPTVTISLPPASIINRTFWSHDGSSVGGGMPVSALSLPVNKGQYAVVLGDTNVPGMTAAVAAPVFTNFDIRLRVWFDDGVHGAQQLGPDQRVSAAAYAQLAATVPDGALTGAKLAAGSVGTAALADGAVTSNKMAAGAVTADKLAAAAVGTAALADGAVSSNKIAAGAVTTPALADSAVTVAKLGGAQGVAGPVAITNPAPATGDGFGFAVAGIGSDMIVIGAPYDDPAGTTMNPGQAYVYRANGTLLATIPNPTPAAAEEFGFAVAGVGGDKIAIGAPWDDADALLAGTVYLYKTNGSLLLTITNPVPTESGQFGFALAGVGSDKIVIGVPYDKGGEYGGLAYLYGTNGALLVTITNPVPSWNDNFGKAVAWVGGDRIAIGAPYDDTGAVDAGTVYLYTSNGTYVGMITNPTPSVGDHFGQSLAGIGGDRIAIGAPDDHAGSTAVGTVYLYGTNGVLLMTITNPLPTAGASFGYALAGVGSDRIAIGAAHDNACGAYAGSVYVYSTGGALLVTLWAPWAGNNDEFGHAVAGVGASGVVGGAYRNDRVAIDAGVAAVYDLCGVRLDGLTAASVANGAIDSTKLAADAVTSRSIVNGAVGSSELADDAVTSNKMATGAVTSAALANGSVTGGKLAAGAVSNLHIAASAVTGDKIASGAISNLHLAAGAVTGAKIASGAISNALLAAGAVTGDKIAAGTISNALLAASAVTSDKIAAGAVSNVDIALGAVGTNTLNLMEVDGRYVLNSGDTMTGGLTVSGTVAATWFSGAGAGLADSNTFFISATAPAGGDGSMGRPWNTLYALTNNAGGRLNGKTVLLLAGTYMTGVDIVFTATYSNLTVKGVDPQNVRVVSTNNNYRIFTCQIGATNIVLDGMTLTSTNNLSAGGAVYIRTGCAVKNCTFIGNVSGGDGGGVYCALGGTVQDCIFVGNSASSSGSGGGLRCYYGGVVKRCTFAGNAAGWGGGASCYFDGLFELCTFSGNTAGNYGGAVYCASGGTIQNCEFSGNTATNGGGGIYCNLGTIQNCTFSGNVTTNQGGAVYASGSSLILNCSILCGGGKTNTVYTSGSGVKWMSVWTNDDSAADFVTFSTSLNN